ncbi:unnamed protein product [Rhizophagus irregularis]|nr:unnamed protein product [Rhizophagus irregularis]CAB5368380.1 unnamed protein product [Rhizophagus irregularis]
MPHLTYYRRSKSTIEKACGIVTYEIDDKCKNNLPLLLIVGWRISLTGKNKWFVFIGCETDPDFPDEDKSSINKYLKENGNKGSDTLEFEEHSMIIDGSISDGTSVGIFFTEVFTPQNFETEICRSTISQISNINDPEKSYYVPYLIY